MLLFIGKLLMLAKVWRESRIPHHERRASWINSLPTADIEACNDDMLLVEIIRVHADPCIVERAAERIRTQAVRAAIARDEHVPRRARVICIARLCDDQDLMRLLARDFDVPIAVLAAYQLSEGPETAALLDSPCDEVRLVIADKLCERSQLARLLKDPSPKVRERAGARYARLYAN